jgi:regulator of nonsense transcripts 2
MEALEKGKNASRKQIGESMVSGSQILKKKEQPKPSDGLAPTSSGIALGGKVGISFQLLKKGNKGKVEAKEILVPADTNLAMVASKQDDAAARERDEIKQRVLRYEAESAEAEYSGGNVYLEQEKLQIIRNRPLSMEEIDRNFGTTGGSLRQSQGAATRAPQTSADVRSHASRGSHTRGGRGRGGRSNVGGRTLFG